MVYMEAFALLVAVSMTFVTWLYFSRKQKQTLFKKVGIPGPSPNWLFGNLHQMGSPALFELIPQWTQTYGKTWGYYEGPTPIIVTSDEELLQEVFVKQFRNFYARKLFPAQEDPDKSKTASIFITRGARWKQMRSTLNPSFTETRMRQMFPLVDDCIAKMVEAVRADVQHGGDADLDIYKYFQLLTLDTICECAFGVQLNAQTDPNNIVIEQLRKVFDQDFSKGSPLMIAGLLFPKLRPILHNIQHWTTLKADNPIGVLRNMMTRVIQERQNAQTKSQTAPRMDLLQMLLDSEVCPMSGVGGGVAPTNTIDHDVNETSPAAMGQCPVASVNTTRPSVVKGDKRKLDVEEIVSQATLFLFAGYETSSTALAYCAFELVRSPHVLDRLHDEIDSAMQDLPEEDKAVGSVNFYRAVCQLPYLEAVLWETLRFHPFVGIIVNRMAMTAPVQLGKYTLPEGVVVAPDVRSVHFNQDLWGPIDPQKFDPDRHLKLKDNGKYEFASRDHAMAMLGFGAGPKNCIGQRFALMEMRACLARFLMNFTLSKGDQTPEILPVRMGTTVAPRNGVWLKVRERK